MLLRLDPPSVHWAMTEKRIHLPASHGTAFRLGRGQSIRIINTHGRQVVDSWAFPEGDMTEFMSMEHSRVHMGHVNPIVGSTLLTNRRRPVLTMVDDCSGGVHDTMMAACGQSIAIRCWVARITIETAPTTCGKLGSLGLVAPRRRVRSIFSRVRASRQMERSPWNPPVASAGSHVTLRTEQDIVIVFSACPRHGADQRIGHEAEGCGTGVRVMRQADFAAAREHDSPKRGYS